MLGTACLSAAIGIKKYLEESGKPGTVIYFGCPGEEGGSGKAFMAKGGVFANLDAAITWHPGDITIANTGSSLANYQVAYKFYGKSAHAGGTPHLGRSALDGLELMNMGVQFLREHVIPEARIHYAITNARTRQSRRKFSPIRATASTILSLRLTRTESCPSAPQMSAM